MAKREYEWETMSEPPLIGRHSLNKHEILALYLERYLDKLYGKAHDYIRFSIVDGFSGGGVYTRPDNGEIHYGSPVLAMNVVNECSRVLAELHGKTVELRARYYFIEKNKKYFQILKDVLRELKLDPCSDGKGGCFQGEFVKLLPGVIDEIQSEGRTHRALFILDQYGYKDVPIVTVQEIFKRLPYAEIILTFAADWLIDYLSAKPGQIARCQRRLDDLGIDCAVEDLLSLKNGVSPSVGRLLIQDLLSEELSNSCGAKYFTRYFLQTENSQGKPSHRSIWLVHMSQHEIARDEMVKVHWQAGNHMSTHAGFQGIDDKGMRGLGYSTNMDARLGQLNLDYNFDDNAENNSVEILLNQLPHLIWGKKEMSFAELMGEVSNHTPVSSDIIRKVLGVLLGNKDIQIYACDGVLRRKGTSVKWTDIIKARYISLFDYGKA